ncbi:hypothetical protein GCM10009549_46280 [Streptomyces thermoalcalitolerans]|uniref:Uncharacterized protein n=1 Tax=Streptomyces thermoalcalitolerans TaxID=65605 RepID=A0ABN1PBG0_9ACTN
MNLKVRTGPDPRSLSTARTSGSDGFTYPSGPLGTKPRPPSAGPEFRPGPEFRSGPEFRAGSELRADPVRGPDSEEPDPEQPDRSPAPAAAIEALSRVRRVYVFMSE